LSIYLDASVLVALLQDEGGSSAAIDFVATADRVLIVSEFARGEVASALSRLVRMNMMHPDAAVDRLDAFDEWVATAAQPIPTEAGDIRLATHFVRRFELGLRMPDAIHLASARARHLTLATLDERMKQVAGQLEIETAEIG